MDTHGFDTLAEELAAELTADPPVRVRRRRRAAKDPAEAARLPDAVRDDRERAWAAMIAALVRWRHRYDIEVEGQPVARPHAYDVEVDSG